MIVKEYLIGNEEVQNAWPGSLLADHHKKIMIDILKNINLSNGENFSYVRPDVIVGFDIIAIMDMNFSFGKIMDFTKLNVPVGFLSGSNVYLDLRLKNNEVIIGNYSEIRSYIIKRERKEKLMKLYDASYDTKNSS